MAYGSLNALRYTYNTWRGIERSFLQNENVDNFFILAVQYV